MSCVYGFKKNQSTVAAYVDLEGAFDGIWRKGVIYKLIEANIMGRMLLYVHSFLSSRKSRNLVNNFVSPWTSTKIGVPQGSVISPLLFIFYIQDMATKLGPHIAFADDLTI